MPSFFNISKVYALRIARFRVKNVLSLERY